MLVKKGTETFGRTAAAAMINEFTQLDKGAIPGKPVSVPTDASTIADEEKHKALYAVNIIKDKRSGDVKGRICANGSK